jgi:hypothetical protein
MLEAEDDELFRRLTRLTATAKTITRSDRRVILSLESDLRLLRKALLARSDALSATMRTAGAGSRAVSAYSRVASLASGRSNHK